MVTKTENGLDRYLSTLYAQGHSTRNIGSRVGLSHVTIQQRLRLLGIQLRDRSASMKGRERLYGRKPLLEKPCQHCGQMIIGRHNFAERKFCSRRCTSLASSHLKSAGIRKPIWLEAQCRGCSTVFPYRKASRFRQYCSRACAVEHLYASKSKLECTVRSWLDDAGIPYRPSHPIGPYVVDMLVHDDLVVEVDGKYWHTLPGAAERDARRDQELRHFGFKVIRLDELDIRRRPALCRKRMLEALANG
jgi:very-short-patch-repair endonuclease